MHYYFLCCIAGSVRIVGWWSGHRDGGLVCRAARLTLQGIMTPFGAFYNIIIIIVKQRNKKVNKSITDI